MAGGERGGRDGEGVREADAEDLHAVESADGRRDRGDDRYAVHAQGRELDDGADGTHLDRTTLHRVQVCRCWTFWRVLY